MSSSTTFPCRFILSDISHKAIATGEADIVLESDRLIVLPRLGESIYLSLIDIIDITAEDYHVQILMSSNEKLSISDLGYKFDDLVASLARARNALIMKYLLINESVRKQAVSGRLRLMRADGTSRTFENCELILYDTSIVFNPVNTDPIRIRYSRITESDVKDFALSLKTATGDYLEFSQMGKELDSTVDELSAALNDLNVQSQALIKDLVPLANPLIIRNAARLMKDGMAAKRSDLDAIAPEIWLGLERKFATTNTEESYKFLKSIARQDRMSGGIKRGLMGDLTGSYLWILAPIYGSGSSGNAIAMESVALGDDRTTVDADDSGQAGGGATYFFRLVGRGQYHELSLSELDSKCDLLISQLNELMLDLNFRREPIFLSETELMEARNARYRYASLKILALKEIRKLFVGRVIHSSFDQWKRDVLDLLTFNASSKDDSARWKVV